jgi:predicted nuclease of restriction endonuclease-like RecB superfamily
MLTSKLVRVRYVRDRVVPCFLDEEETAWLEAAERLLELFRRGSGMSRSELEEELDTIIGADPAQLVHRGLAKLLDDRCEYEVRAGHPPEELRDLAFRAAAAQRAAASAAPLTAEPALFHFDRAAVLQDVARSLGLTAEAVDQGLFADLKGAQRLIVFKDITAKHLLQRYNVALAQGVLLRSSRVHVAIRGESPQRYRQLFRLVKFHRLVCELEAAKPEGYQLHLDGPLSLFTATQKYGLQLALFLPAVLNCKNFELHAELSWGPQRKAKKLILTPADGLVSHYQDTGMFVPPEMRMFVELFRKKVADFDISEESAILPLGESFWVPDYSLTERATHRRLFLEVLGFWRRASVERHLQRLRECATDPFLLAVSDQLHVDDGELEGLPAAIHRFRQMPLPEEVARLARELLA